MRLSLILAVMAAPAYAWDFSPTPICTLSHNETVRVTFDGAEYAIHLTRPDGWVEAPVFSMRFEGGVPISISTQRHMISGDTLTVTDRGFGNVLNGLQFNASATATLGDQELTIDLSGAAPYVEAFRTCPVDISV